MDWFFGLSADTLAALCNGIKSGGLILTDDLQGISRLNGILYNFLISNFDNCYKFGYGILKIDEQYNSWNLEELLSVINKSRRLAGIREVREDEPEGQLYHKREQISRIIGERAESLSEEDYVAVITAITELCLADSGYIDGVVVSDLLDRYEIRIQSSLEKLSSEIYAQVERLKWSTKARYLEENSMRLVCQVRKWDRLIRPLQLKSISSGLRHGSNSAMGKKLFDFCVWIYEPKCLPELAFRLMNVLKPVFSEMEECASAYEAASKKIQKVLQEDEKNRRLFDEEMEAVREIAERLKISATVPEVYEFIYRVRALNEKAKEKKISRKLTEHIRSSVYSVARDVALALYTDQEKREYAHRIYDVIDLEFGDYIASNSKPSVRTTR